MLASNPSGAAERSALASSQGSQRSTSSVQPRDSNDHSLERDIAADLSEAETLGVSSPELSPISAPARAGLAPRTPRSVTGHQNNEFYTASWGSPYDVSLVPAGRHSTSSNRQHLSGALALALDDIDEDSPQVSFGLSHLIPSRLSVSNVEITPTRPSTPSGWSPNQDTPRIPGVEVIDPESVKIAARDLFTSLSSARTQTRPSIGARNIVGEGFQDIDLGNQSARQAKGHRSHDQNRTLRQEDIAEQRAVAIMDSSKYATSSPRARSESIGTPIKTSADNEAASPQRDWAINTAPGPPFMLDRGVSKSDAAAAAALPARVKKRLAYKGKTCWINLPHDVRRGQMGEYPVPMSTKDIAHKLAKLRDVGYNTEGFDHQVDTEYGGQISNAKSQTCSVYPPPVQSDPAGKSPRPSVYIPDIRQWQEYVKELKEAKLRALGVSLGDEPAEPPPSLSRVPSSQFSGLPFSPPLPSTSASSHRMSIGGTVFPHGFVPGSSNHTSTRSIASPLSSLSNPRHSLHMHRQSMFISPPLSQQQAMSPHGLQSWSPQPFGFSTASVSAASPGLSSGAADMRSPISPFGGLIDSATSFQFPQRTELVAQLHNQKQQQLLRQSQILPARPASTLAEVPESETEEEVVASKSRSVPPEMFNPRPGHRHNISEKLEANVSKGFNLGKPDKSTLPDDEDNNGEVMHERSIKEEKDAIPEWRQNAPLIDQTQKTAGAVDEIDRSVSVNERTSGNSKDKASSLSYNSDVEIDFVASTDTAADPKLTESIDSNPWESDPTFQREATTSEKRPSISLKHSSKLSLTGLNVEAKEFKFNPKANPAAIFNPSIFSASSLGFNPENVQPFIPRSSSNHPASPPLSASVSTLSKSLLNIDAPAFSPSGFGGSELSNSEFHFAPAPILKPTAAVFEPGAPSVVSDSVFSASAGSETNRLFGSVNLEDFANLDKKSKALSITSPQSGSAGNTELLDEDGRLGQGFAKRTRRAADDGDDVPLFADPYPARFNASNHSPSEAGKETVETLSDKPETGNDVEAGSSDLEEPEEDSLFDLLTGKDDAATTTIPESNLGSDPRDISLFDDADQLAVHTDLPVRNSLLPQEVTPSPKESDNPIVVQIDDSTQLSPAYVSEDDERLDDLSEPLMSPPSSAAVSKPSADADFDSSQREELNFSSPLRKLPSSVRYYDELDQPTFQEIDAIMQQFNDGGSDFGVERDLPSWPETSPGSLSTARPNFFANTSPRPELPKTSTVPARLEVLQADIDSASVTQDPFSDARAVNGYESPALQNADENNRAASDWNDFSSGVEDRIRARGPFLDSHVSELINSTLARRLGPLEKQLENISSSMINLSVTRSGRRALSRATLDSDADDEDDEVATGIHSRAWSRSPVRDRKTERMRAVIQEALSNHRPQADPLSGAIASSVILDALNEMRVVVTAEISKSLQQDTIAEAVESALLQRNLHPSQTPAPAHLDEIRAAIETAIASHTSVIAPSRGENDDESSALSELLQKNIELTAKTAEESEARKTAEQRHTESARMLRLAEEEVTLLRASVKDHELLHVTQSAKAQALELRAAAFDTSSTEMQGKVTAVTETNVALKATLEEYRLSHDKWRKDMDSVNREREKLAGISGVLKLQAEEAVRIRQSMSERLEKLSTDAAHATGKLVDERSKWQAADSEYRNRLSYWKDKAEAERVTRENFERKIEGIEALDRENMKLRHHLDHLKHEKDRLQADNEKLYISEREVQKRVVSFEHLQTEHAKLEGMVDKFRNESNQHEQAAEKYAREWREARDNGQQEVQRVRILLQAEVDAANSHASIVRSGFEGEIARLQAQLQNTKQENVAARAKAEAELEEEADARRDAIRDVIDGKTAALTEQKQAYEERLEELRRQHRRDLDHVIENKNQSETFLREAHAQRLADVEQQHQRAVEQAYEDKERVETYLSERLVVADGKVELLQDKIAHLTSKVSTAQSAAQAAAQIAQTARGTQATQPVVLPSAVGGLSGASSAALRESLQVLQDQLQERQLQIESLESQVEKVDETLPEQLRAREVEVNWLRELLGVRMDDLSELCDLLARDDFDREAVHNAAIRIKTGLKMNVQERERQADGNTPLAAGAANLAASLQSFATPKAAQLARVIGEWRSTPARRASQPTSGFLSGLMTPPATNVRRTPEQPNTVELRRGSSASTSSQLNIGQSMSTRKLEKSRAGFPALSLNDDSHDGPPRTPLLNAHVYDDDAETRYSTDGYYDDEESTVEGTPRRARQRLDS